MLGMVSSLLSIVQSYFKPVTSKAPYFVPTDTARGTRSEKMGHYEVRLAARLIQLAARLIRQFIVLIDLSYASSISVGLGSQGPP